MRSIGFLTFGHWQFIPGSRVRTAADALLQTVELAEAAEELGVDGAYVRVHHFARQLASPFPLLAAMAARTSRIELGTGVIDMRYENPLAMAEQAAATDLLSAGRTVMVQRYLESVDQRGETALIYMNGLVSHAKAARELGYSPRRFSVTLRDTYHWLKGVGYC